MSDEDPIKQLGLWCPDGGDFYVCGNNSTEFIGCCTSDPCSDGGGNCPSRDLREASFSPDRYASIPAQSCDDNRGDRVWYTCRDNSPPFMGCCASVPCGDGCPRDHLIQAVLSDDEDDRLAFLPSAASSGSSTISPTSSPSTTPSDSPNPGSSSSELSTGAIAGIAVGGVAALVIVGVLLWLCRRRARKSNDGHHHPEMVYNEDMPSSPLHPGPRDSRMSAATTAIPHSYHTTPTTPDFPKQYAHYSHPHHQHPSQQSPPLMSGHPHSIYSQVSDSDNSYLSPHQRHLSQMSAMSDPHTVLHPVSEIDGVEREAPRVELPADDSAAPRQWRQQ